MEVVLKEIINKILDTNNRDKIEYLNDCLSLRNDIGFDSLDLAELTVHLEKEFGVDIFEDGLVDTIADVKQKLKK